MVKRREVALGRRRIGPGHPCFVIAEAGVNHNGDPALAARLVDAAAEAGADAVKLQTFDPAALASPSAPRAEYQREAGQPGDQRTMLERLVLSPAAHRELKARAERRGLVFLSSPFDEASADLLESLGVLAFKIPSGELTDHPFLAHVARKGRPLLISTGMADAAEVEAALAVVEQSGAPPVCLFHCVSCYPARSDQCNLRAMGTLRRSFEVPVGWSDHTPGIEIALAAAALGADLVEKHLTLDRGMAGPDHRASIEPPDFARMVAGIRAVAAALGTGEKVPHAEERAIAAVARKSLHFRQPLPTGTRLAPVHVVALRPGTGVAPSRLAHVLGRPLLRAVAAGEPLREEDLGSPA